VSHQSQLVDLFALSQRPLPVALHQLLPLELPEKQPHLWLAVRLQSPRLV
jgi:hypothetical protein